MGLKRHDELSPERPADFGRQVRYPSPNIEDLVVVEDLSIQPSKYEPLPYGTHHPDYANNGLILVWQGPVKAANNQVRVRRVYATEQETPDDWHNYAIKFSGDAVANPIFIRSTIVLRKDYEPTARGTTIADPNDGAPTGQVPTFNQPAGAVLVKEETTRLGSDDQQLDSLFIRVHKVYEVLPGPWIPFTRYDDDLGPIQGRKRAVRNTGQTASLAIGTKTTYDARDGSSIVSLELEETWDDALFPETYDDFYDDDRGAVQSVTKLVERTGFEVGTFIVSGGIATKVSYKAYNKFLLRQTIETWDEPGPVRTDDFYDGERGAVEVESQEIENTGLEVGTLIASGGAATLVEYKAKNAEILVATVSVWALPGPVLRDKERYDDDYGKITSTRKLVANTGQAQTEGAASRKRYLDTKYGPEVLWEVTESWDTAAFPIKTTDDYDKARGATQITSRLVVAVGNEAGSLNVAGSTATYTHYEPVNEFLLRRLIETWTVPGIELTTRSIGQDNLTPAKYRRLITRGETNQQVESDYTFPVALTGDQTYIELAEESAALARLKIVQEIIDIDAEPLVGEETSEHGILSITEEIVNEGDPADEGFLIIKSTVSPLGNGKSIKITVQTESYPVIESEPFDEEMRGNYARSEQVVDAGTPADVSPADGAVEEIIGKDVWRSVRIITSKTPTAVDEASAIVSYKKGPYTFPGRLDFILFVVLGGFFSHKKPFAELVQITLKTWWVTSSTAPVITVPDIITDTVRLTDDIHGGNYTFENVLHDAFQYWTGLPVAATMPSYAEFAGITYEAGSFTFTQGEAVPAHGSAVAGDSIWGFLVGSTWPLATQTIGVIQIQRPSTGWIGNPIVIGADVRPAKERNRWRVETQSVVMR